MKKTIITIITLLLVFLIASAAIALSQRLQMSKQDQAATDFEMGAERRAELEATGMQVDYRIYSEDEITENAGKSDVILSFFPASEKKSERFVIVCPGGAYATCETGIEGDTPAALLNELGYNAFVLKYRVGENGGNYAAIEDLAKAVEYIEENASLFGIETDEYALMGFSAGGNLIGLFASEDMGYAQYGVTKPSYLMMGYPWSELNTKTLNPVKYVMYARLNNMGYQGLIGADASSEEKSAMCVSGHITEGYPKTYIMHGVADMLVPIKTHSDVLYDALVEHQVQVEYERVEGVHHGVGIGENTAAAGWIERALEYWN